MSDPNISVSVSLEAPLAPLELFDAIVAEVSTSLQNHWLELQPGAGGNIRGHDMEHARVTAWESGKLIRFEWRAADWSEQASEVELRVEPTDQGSRATLSHRGWADLIGCDSEAAGWFASEVVAPFLRAITPERLGDWVTDRRARRPSGAGSRGMYREPVYHYPNFKVILAELALKPTDHLIEIGCGGGAMLNEALKSGCRAAAIDHSLEMVQTARQTNSQAIAEGRLVIEQASADHLPFPDSTFTAAAMTGVLGFLPDAVAAFREIRRVLRDGGRMVVMGADPAMRGTPAAPEPMASRLHFYTDEQHRQLALDAGFAEARVVRRNLLEYAREAGVPEEHLALFENPAPFLIARK